jgi:predicted small lipoprotein YifL
MAQHAVKITVLAALAVGLAGCGLRGDLVRPAPLLGGEDRREAEAATETAEDAARTARAQAAARADAAEAAARKAESQR